MHLVPLCALSLLRRRQPMRTFLKGRQIRARRACRRAGSSRKLPAAPGGAAGSSRSQMPPTPGPAHRPRQSACRRERALAARPLTETPPSGAAPRRPAALPPHPAVDRKTCDVLAGLLGYGDQVMQCPHHIPDPPQRHIGLLQVSSYLMERSPVSVSLCNLHNSDEAREGISSFLCPSMRIAC